MKKIIFLCILLLGGSLAQAQDNTEFEICPTLIGQDVPDATLHLVDGSEVRFHDLVKDKATVLIFYRGSWCPYCNRHLADVGTIEAELIEMGYQILAISPDQPDKLGKMTKKQDLKYTLLSDSKMELIDGMGLGFNVSQATINKYNLVGINLKKASGEDHQRLPVPAVYIVNESGTVIFNYVNPSISYRAKAELILAAARTASKKN